MWVAFAKAFTFFQNVFAIFQDRNFNVTLVKEFVVLNNWAQLFFFPCFSMNMCYACSLELPHWGRSYVKYNTSWLKKSNLTIGYNIVKPVCVTKSDNLLFSILFFTRLNLDIWRHALVLGIILYKCKNWNEQGKSFSANNIHSYHKYSNALWEFLHVQGTSSPTPILGSLA